MANNKKSFILYCDLIHTVKKLPKEKQAELFIHILEYVNDLDPKTDDLLLNIAFEPIKQSLKRDLKKYEGKKEERSDAGSLGNLKRWNTDLYDKVVKEEMTLQKALEVAKHRKTSLSDNSIANVAVSVSDSVSDIKESKPHLADEAIDFNSLLDAYNKLTGKKAKVVNDKTKKQIKARFKEGYTKDDLWDAMVNCSKDPFHIENGYKHFTLEFISRADKLDKFSTAKPIKQKTNDYGKL